jgi:hypothetical protein
MFSSQKSKFGQTLEDLEMKQFGVFYVGPYRTNYGDLE